MTPQHEGFCGIDTDCGSAPACEMLDGLRRARGEARPATRPQFGATGLCASVEMSTNELHAWGYERRRLPFSAGLGNSNDEQVPWCFLIAVGTCRQHCCG